MVKTMAEISDEMSRRRSSLTPMLQRMIDIRDRYNADVIVPVPEVDDDVPYESLAPLLIADAVDHPALYASQAPPNLFVPALDPAKPDGVRSTNFANRRRKALHWAWDKSWWEMVVGRFYRHLAAYATSALVVSLDEAGYPTFSTRDPLSCYPEPRAAEDLTLPTNCGFIRSVSMDYMHARYPQTRDRYPQPSGISSGRGDGGEMWDLIEWMDEEEIVYGVLGPRDSHNSWISDPTKYAFELNRYPNILGRCPAVIPRRVTLDKVMSQLSNLTGHVDIMAKLMYLDIRATERSVFPDRYVMAKTGQNPRLVDGTWHSGETGKVNMVLDADAIGNLPGSPDPNNKQTLGQLERNFRVSSGLIPQAGGETYGALRTGRGIDALMGAALDPRTTELHRVAERYLTTVNELLLTGFAKQWPSKSYSVYSPLDPGAIEFIPSEHVERDGAGDLFVENRVYYPIPGMDDINATQVIGQMMGAKLISTYDARRMHPHVNDPEGTERRLLQEEMTAMAVASLGQRAMTPPGIPPIDLARMIELVGKGKQVHEAIQIADKEAQERQAAEPATPADSMPGMANPGEGEEMMGAGPPGGGGKMDQLGQMMAALTSGGPPGAPQSA